MPSGAILVSQMLWGSIGWSVGELLLPSHEHSVHGCLGSALGAALAAHEKGSERVILFVGEGSL